MPLQDINLAPYMTSPFEIAAQQAIQAPLNMQKIQAGQLANQMAGARAQALPQQLQTTQSLRDQQLQASIMTNQYLPQTLKNKAALDAAQASLAEAKAKDPLGSTALPGAAGQVQGLEVLIEKYGPNSWQVIQARKIMGAQATRAASYAARVVPVDFRSKKFAIAATLGYDSQSANKLFMQGDTLADLARMKGKSLSDINPNYPSTHMTVSNNQKVVQATNALNVMNEFVANKGLAYGGVLAHFTHPWYFDSLSSDPIKRQKSIDYYAAQALAPEMSNYRMRMQGGQGSQAAIEAITPKVVGNIKVDSSYLSPAMQGEVQMQVQKVMDEAIAAQSKGTLSPNPNIQLKSDVEAKQRQAGTPIPQSAPAQGFPTSFSSKADFLNWYKGLTPQQQSAYKSSLGGQ